MKNCIDIVNITIGLTESCDGLSARVESDKCFIDYMLNDDEKKKIFYKHLEEVLKRYHIDAFIQDLEITVKQDIFEDHGENVIVDLLALRDMCGGEE